MISYMTLMWHVVTAYDLGHVSKTQVKWHFCP